MYAPFNGAGKEGHHVRRREWDAQLLLEMEDPGPYSKARILLGDLNVVNNDSDISGSPEFWKKQGDQTVEEGDRGFGGTTENERRRFAEILRAGSMTDIASPPLGVCTWRLRLLLLACSDTTARGPRSVGNCHCEDNQSI